MACQKRPLLPSVSASSRANSLAAACTGVMPAKPTMRVAMFRAVLLMR